MLRISEVLHWTPVSTSSGSDPERDLSFQRAWLPLLRVSVANVGAVVSYMAQVSFLQYRCEEHCASTCEVCSPLVYLRRLIKFRSALYSIIMNDFELFSKTLITSMDEMVARQSFVNHLMPTTRNLLGSQILASISGVLFQYDMIVIIKMLSDAQC